MSAQKAPKPQPCKYQKGKAVGRVTLYAPTAGEPNYRIKFTDPSGRLRSTTVGRDEQEAIRRARAKDQELGSSAGPKSVMTIQDAIAEYTATGRGRNQKTGGDWTDGQLRLVKRNLDRAVRAVPADTPCFQLNEALLRAMRDTAGTRSMDYQQTGALRGFVRWGVVRTYFSQAQASLLPEKMAPLKQAEDNPRPQRSVGRAKRAGESSTYVRDEDAPTAELVLRLGDQLQLLRPWGKLAVEVAAGCGLRWGEEFQLTAYDLVLDDDDFGAHLLLDFQINDAAKADCPLGRRSLPKHGKQRIALVPSDTTITGYDLVGALKERRAEALLEQTTLGADGQSVNPQALLFPAPRGGLLWHTGFNNDLFSVAAQLAGWPKQTWAVGVDEGGATVEHMQWRLTWHSLRHRFARTAVDVWKMDRRSSRSSADGRTWTSSTSGTTRPGEST